ncbi:MAG: 4-alpha-glucanotransferase [Polyangiales bacterium]
MSDASSSRFSLGARASGVLMHLTSLPGPHGNGDLGGEARGFVEFLARAGQRWWQMLPVNPVGAGYSPYSGVSAFAGSPLFIDLVGLADEGLVPRDALTDALPEDRTDYAAATALRARALRLSFTRFAADHARYRDELAEFRARAAYWLPDYALFMALKQSSEGRPWTTWEPALRRHEPEALAEARARLADEVAYFEFEQFVFDRQWTALRSFAAERGVGLIGDVPIFVAHDSADVWGHQPFFDLDAEGAPRHVSGVPPDYFSATGQRWGTPLYRWKALARASFAFWIERLRTLLARFDVIRLDHFIGFARYWQIPASEPTAVNGRWLRGPGRALFDEAGAQLGGLPFIAEDLGSVTPKVRRLRDRYRMPGMRVLQFAFGGDPNDDFLPHRYVRNCVAYSGTHDNDTSVGWLEDPGSPDGPRTPETASRECARALTYLRGPHEAPEGDDFHWEMLRALYASVADTAIVPMQDLLGLGSAARMNVPGVTDGNWGWRVSREALSESLADRVRTFAHVYGRAAR